MTEPHHTTQHTTLYHGNNLHILPTLPDNSVDAIVTDPPYELGFMGKQWDSTGIAYNVDLWRECLRVLKPGGHLCAFGGTRTYHRMAVAIEDAGFDIRDSLHWIQGQGFPKSLDVNKTVGDSACKCEVQWSYGSGHPSPEHSVRSVSDIDLPSTINPEKASREVLLASVPKQSAHTDRTEGAESETRWREQSSMEGRRDAQEGQGQLHRPEVRQMSAGVSADGTQGRVHHGTSPSHGSVDRSTTEPLGSGESHQPQSEGQPAGESGVVPEQRRSQAWGGWQVCGGCGKPILPEGLGTALKPAHEPIVLARKPLTGTVAANVLQHGTGALNIDATRVEVGDDAYADRHAFGDSQVGKQYESKSTSGRWPANVILDTEAGQMLNEQSGPVGSWSGNPSRSDGTIASGKIIALGERTTTGRQWEKRGGGASRFFTSIDWHPEIDVPFMYIAKPSRRERNAGLDGMPEQNKYKAGGVGGTGGWRDVQKAINATPTANFHPTVKPLALMQWLIRLVTPPDGTVLDPFAGSGTTLAAATIEHFHAIGIELTDDYLPIIVARCEWAETQTTNRTPTLFDND